VTVARTRVPPKDVLPFFRCTPLKMLIIVLLSFAFICGRTPARSVTMHSSLFFVTAKRSGFEDDGVEKGAKEAADCAQCYRGNKQENVHRDHLYTWMGQRMLA